MARKVKKQEAVESRALDRFRILQTIGPTHAAWKDEKVLASPGAIVRIRPPADAEDAEIESLRARVDRWAERVVVLPRPRAEALPEKARHPGKVETARDAVLRVIEESNSKDKARLRNLCEEVMSAVGL